MLSRESSATLISAVTAFIYKEARLQDEKRAEAAARQRAKAEAAAAAKALALERDIGTAQRLAAEREHSERQAEVHLHHVAGIVEAVAGRCARRVDVCQENGLHLIIEIHRIEYRLLLTRSV